MKADWDDAPQYLKRKRQSAGKWVVAISIGVTFTALAVYVADHKLPFPPEPPIAQVPPQKATRRNTSSASPPASPPRHRSNCSGMT